MFGKEMTVGGHYLKVLARYSISNYLSSVTYLISTFENMFGVFQCAKSKYVDGETLNE